MNFTDTEMTVFQANMREAHRQEFPVVGADVGKPFDIYTFISVRENIPREVVKAALLKEYYCRDISQQKIDQELLSKFLSET